MMRRNWLDAWMFCLLWALAVPAAAETVTVDAEFDRWMYPFNFTPGARPSGSVFGALGVDEFDNRDGQILLGFDVTAAGPTSSLRQLEAVRLSVTTSAADTFVYDPTWDPLETYTTGTDPDDGRPLELFGVGTRNGFTRLTLEDAPSDPTAFGEQTSFAPFPGQFRGTRSAFAADFPQGQAWDVSNNISEGHEVLPWAVGVIDQLSPGTLVPANTELSFAIDLSRQQVADYITRGLSEGEVYFALTGLHEASQAGPATFPSFHLDAGGVRLGQIAQLELQFRVVPEPAFWGGWLVGGLVWLTRRGGVRCPRQNLR